MKKVLILEPYFGGSHQHFLQGLMTYVKADYHLMSLPARKWKMRMQLSAQWFIQQLELLQPDKRYFDTVLCSTFVDVTVFRALTSTLKGWNRDVKICLYFHENQFAYPNQTNDKALYQFTAINFNSALAADSIAFNSSFNERTFLEGCSRYLKFSSDMKFNGLIDSLKDKSSVIYPGIDFSSLDQSSTNKDEIIPVIVWNHRWEHDKNPEMFFEGLKEIKDKGLKFQLIVLGQSFANSPKCFAACTREFERELLHFGYAESYKEYCQLLGKGTVVVSTSLHEFYGISIIEALRSGCRPLLPKRLSYPELFPGDFLYDEGDFQSQLEKLVIENRPVDKFEAKALTDRFSWAELKNDYREWLL